MLRWFGHVEWMNGRRMTKLVYEANMHGSVQKGRPRKIFKNQKEPERSSTTIPSPEESGDTSLKNRRLCMKRTLDVNEAREVYKDRVKWRSIVSA